ncbi:MAG TPA: hypothetical protein VI997_02215 [Candidatus Thermoplasmatota archaeon]|nr:hypothetical protein [Candidatus Thermoplasmatota archaeon]
MSLALRVARILGFVSGMLLGPGGMMLLDWWRARRKRQQENAP